MSSSYILEEFTLLPFTNRNASTDRHNWKLEWERAFFEQQKKIKTDNKKNMVNVSKNSEIYSSKERKADYKPVISDNEEVLRETNAEMLLLNNTIRDNKQVKTQGYFNYTKKAITYITNMELIAGRHVLSKSASGGTGCTNETIFASMPGIKKDYKQNILMKKTDDGIQLWIWEKSLKEVKLNKVIEFLKCRFNDKNHPLLKLTINGQVAWEKHTEASGEPVSKINIQNNTIDTKY
ncbi:MAG: hypothetical protein KZQ88_07505 [Candidatus Thiodiazotropha sp. (ex Dulcina madagascariensis)]|nr:hypothetical protein [Candidatus Thiodiazotropha sp. (ex Dulcina madagascariensis)]MCU7925843.1 hypothetical protein [Candidatus Thiodiazotropha sp. (ex Dulcina madagascariensis)]